MLLIKRFVRDVLVAVLLITFSSKKQKTKLFIYKIYKYIS